MPTPFSSERLRTVLGTIAATAGLYGAIGVLVPATSAGTTASVLFFIIGAAGLTYYLLPVALNPQRPGLLQGAGAVSEIPVYSSAAVWGARCSIVLVLATGAAGALLNYLKMEKQQNETARLQATEAVHLVTDSVQISGDNIEVSVTVWNNTEQKISISSFSLSEYARETTCAYSGHVGRYGVDLSPNVPAKGLSYAVDPGDFLPFRISVGVASYSCMFVAFGISFSYSNAGAEMREIPSDAVYFLKTDPFRVEFLRPDRLDTLLNPSNPSSFTYKYVEPYPQKYYDLAKELLERHSALGSAPVTR